MFNRKRYLGLHETVMHLIIPMWCIFIMALCIYIAHAGSLEPADVLREDFLYKSNFLDDVIDSFFDRFTEPNRPDVHRPYQTITNIAEYFDPNYVQWDDWLPSAGQFFPGWRDSMEMSGFTQHDFIFKHIVAEGDMVSVLVECEYIDLHFGEDHRGYQIAMFRMTNGKIAEAWIAPAVIWWVSPMSSESPPTLEAAEYQKLLDTLLGNSSTSNKHRKAVRNYCMALLMLDAGL